MSHPITVAREAFRNAYLDMAIDFEINHRLIKGIEHPDEYFKNVDDALKVAAFDAAVEAVAQATKTLEVERLIEVLSAAGLKYRPEKWEVREDGSRWVTHATVEELPLSGHRA